MKKDDQGGRGVFGGCRGFGGGFGGGREVGEEDLEGKEGEVDGETQISRQNPR